MKQKIPFSSALVLALFLIVGAVGFRGRSKSRSSVKEWLKTGNDSIPDELKNLLQNRIDTPRFIAVGLNSERDDQLALARAVFRGKHRPADSASVVLPINAAERAGEPDLNAQDSDGLDGPGLKRHYTTFYLLQKIGPVKCRLSHRTLSASEC